MRILVTGGAGFIGRHIVEHFHNRAEVRVIDNLRSGSKSNLDGFRCELVVGSVLDRTLVREAMKGVEFVFHLAALVSVPGSIRHPSEYTNINAGGTALVLEEAARARAKKLIFSSSAAIYGDNPTVPKVETMPPEPKSPYAMSKSEGEGYCRSFADAGRLATVSLRYFNVFGPYQNRRSEYSAVIPGFIEQAIRNEPITIFGDGGQTRDFVYVDDVVAANEFFALTSPATGVFNIARGTQTPIRDLASTICKLTRSSSPINYVAQRPGDVKHSVANIDKTHNAGFAAACSLEEGLHATIEFFRNNKTAIQAPRYL